MTVAALWILFAVAMTPVEVLLCRRAVRLHRVAQRLEEGER